MYSICLHKWIARKTFFPRCHALDFCTQDKKINIEKEKEPTDDARKFDEFKPHDFPKYAFKNKANPEEENLSPKLDQEIFREKKFTGTSHQRSNRSNKYFQSKRNDLVKIFKNDLHYFKFDENVKSIDIKQKYLHLAKLYHPDLRAHDKHANAQFNKLKESYERLKKYCELREEIAKMENNISSDGTITLEQGFYESDLGNNASIITKEETIKQMMLEDEFGDIKEPKHVLSFLITFWIVIGLCIFYYDIKKYIKSLKKKRPGVNYHNNLK